MVNPSPDRKDTDQNFESELAQLFAGFEIEVSPREMALGHFNLRPEVTISQLDQAQDCDLRNHAKAVEEVVCSARRNSLINRQDIEAQLVAKQILFEDDFGYGVARAYQFKSGQSNKLYVVPHIDILIPTDYMDSGESQNTNPASEKPGKPKLAASTYVISGQACSAPAEEFNNQVIIVFSIHNSATRESERRSIFPIYSKGAFSEAVAHLVEEIRNTGKIYATSPSDTIDPEEAIQALKLNATKKLSVNNNATSIPVDSFENRPVGSYLLGLALKQIRHEVLDQYLSHPYASIQLVDHSDQSAKLALAVNSDRYSVTIERVNGRPEVRIA